MPVDALVVRAHDQYVFEREAVIGSGLRAANLFHEPVGSPMTPGAINELELVQAT